MSVIVARKTELARLERLHLSKRAEFLAIYGRRRVGKTYLISEYFKDKGLYFEITGTKGASKSEQLRKYHREFRSRFADQQQDLTTPKDWEEAFHRLKNAVAQVSPERRVILFFDELPWLAGARSGFLKELDYYWNRHFSRMNNVIVIICGSAAEWMVRHVIHDKGGLYGRLSDTIHLQPFTLTEVEAYLQSRNIRLDRKQIVELYMVLGGVGKYLSYIERGLSTAQLIDQLCFTPQGPLLIEFPDLFRSLFDGAEHHVKIVRTLAKKRNGLQRSAILDALGLETGGHLTMMLDELEASGFVLNFRKFGQQKKETAIRLLDEYSLFYLSFIEAARVDIIQGTDENFWQKKHGSRQWSTWAGYAFETVCLKHIKAIKQALGIAAINTTQAQWFYAPQHTDEQGAQIDLLIDRADNCINLCEIKFCNDEYVITKDYAQQLEQKRQVFMRQTKTKKAVFITMITPYGVKKNDYYTQVVDQQLTLDALFI